MFTRLLALFGILLAASVAAHTPPETPAGQATEQPAGIESLARGTTFTSRQEQYQLLPEVRAARRRPGEHTAQQALRRLGTRDGDYLGTKGRYVLVRTSPQTVARLEKTPQAELYPTALNARTGGIGILPGTLIVQPRDMTKAAAIAADHGLEPVRTFAHLNATFYRVPPGKDLLAAAAALAVDVRVVSAEIEVLEHLRVPK